MGGLFPSPRPSCVEAGLYRALFTTGRTYKDQSEQRGGGTSERRKKREGQRGRRHSKKIGKKEEERRDGMGKREGPQALAHVPAPERGKRGLLRPLTHGLEPVPGQLCYPKVRVGSGLGPLPAQSKGEGPRPPAHPAAPDNLVSKHSVQRGWHTCCSRHRQETGPDAGPQDDKSGRRG